jgi:fatty acid-binding protein DegV
LFAIVVDKASDVTAAWGDKHDVFIVQQISDDTLPAAAEFIRTFEKCAALGYADIVCVTMSAAITHTYDSAVAAARKVKNDMNVVVVDSESFSAGEILVVRELAACNSRGVPFDESVRRAEAVAEKTRMYIVSAPDARMLETAHGGVAKRMRAAFFAWNGEYAVTEISGGRMQEIGHGRDMRELCGRVVRRMSRYSREHGPLRYVEAVSGNEESSIAFDKSLNTNEFPSTREMVMRSQDVVSRQAGYGAIAIAYVPENVISF